MGAHRDNIAVHAIRRLRERKGLEISRAEYEAISADLANCRGLELRSGSRAIPCTIRGRKVIALYCDRRRCVVTFFPNSRWLFGKSVQPIGMEA